MNVRSLITTAAAVGLATGFACNTEREDVQEERQEVQEEKREMQEEKRELQEEPRDEEVFQEGQGGVFEEPNLEEKEIIE